MKINSRSALYFPTVLLLLASCSSAAKKQKPEEKKEPLAQNKLPAESEPKEPAEDKNEISLEKPIHKEQKNAWPVLKEKGKKRKAPVYYSGDQFIRETKYNPFFKRKEITMSISGNALIRSGNNELRAPVLSVYGESSSLAHAPRSVTILDKKNRTEIKAAEGIFIRNENRVLLRGNARSVHYMKKSKRKVKLRADEMERLADQALTIARGQVAVESDGIFVYGKKAMYYENESRLVFTDEPKIYRENDIVSGDEIEIFFEQKKAYLKSNVQVLFAEAGSENRKKAIVTGKARAHSAIYNYGPENALARSLLLKGQKKAQVTIERSSDDAAANEMEIFGDQTEIVVAQGEVKVRQKADGSTMYAEYLKNMRLTGFLQMKSVKDRKKRPRIEFFDKDGKKTGELESDLIERTHLAADIQARGNVVLVMAEDDIEKPKTKLGGSWANLKEDPSVVKFFGNPYVGRGDKKVFATEIQLYPKEGRYEMSGFLHGSFE